MSNGSVAQRFRMALNREEGMKSLDQVALDYGYVEGVPFTFDDHEYQIEIMRDTAARIDIRKCSQVGASELWAQKTLAMCAVLKNIRIMFSQPTKEMAVKFSKDRIDGVIEQSPYYGGLVAPGGNAAGMKKIGSNMLYIIGTFGANSAISIPAEIIICDEVDFSNEVVLGKLNSRLRHAKSVNEYGDRGFRYRFSTPTVDGFGIDKGFQAGDQRYYMCKCEHCSKWVVPDYMTDFIIPGWDKPIIEFGIDNMGDNGVDIEGSWIKCSNCGNDLFQSLCNAANREWVAKHPDRHRHSYQIYPWDVPKYNTPAAIARQYDDYPLKSDFFNFVIGLPYSDAENSFITNDEHRARVCDVDLWIFGRWQVLCQTVGGMDVGKTCHLTVKAKVGKGWHVVWMEKIINTKNDPAVPKVLARFDFYRMKKLCIDSGPDITLVNLLVSARAEIKAVVYTNVPGFIPIAEGRGEDIINADRTKTLSLLLQQHNGGDTHYPHNEELKQDLFKHLATTKKVKERAADGQLVEKFIKTDRQDHWVHSLNYCNIAAMACEMLEDNSVVGVMPGIAKVQMGSAAKTPEKDPVDILGNALSGMFGGRGPFDRYRNRR